MIRFLADACLRQSIVEGCLRREPAMDFLSTNAANLEGVPDPNVLIIAASQGRILVTSDVHSMPGHFADFLISGGVCPGVFLVSQRRSVGDVVEALVLIWSASSADEWNNRIVEVPLRS